MPEEKEPARINLEELAKEDQEIILTYNSTREFSRKGYGELHISPRKRIETKVMPKEKDTIVLEKKETKPKPKPEPEIKRPDSHKILLLYSTDKPDYGTAVDLDDLTLDIEYKPIEDVKQAHPHDYLMAVLTGYKKGLLDELKDFFRIIMTPKVGQMIHDQGEAGKLRKRQDRQMYGDDVDSLKATLTLGD